MSDTAPEWTIEGPDELPDSAIAALAALLLDLAEQDQTEKEFDK